MKPVKLGIIGCGIAARELHLPALENLSDKFEIVCVCNHTEQKAKELANMIGKASYVTDYREILNNSEIEAVDIALPVEYNSQVTKESLESGKHVIVEKPIAVNMDEAEEMLTYESRYSRVMMVAENFRYEPVFLRLKEYLDSGKIGKPFSVFWNCYSFMDLTNKFAQTKWRIYHKYPGGFITDAGVHNVAALRDLFGEIDSGISFTKSVNPSIGEMDSMSFIFNTKNNVNGIFNFYHSSNGYFERKLVILGTQGSIAVEENKITIMKENNPETVETVDGANGFQAEFEDFYKAIREGKKVKASFQESYKDLKTIIGALNSARKFDTLKF